MASKKIRNNFTIYTHCHSSTVTSILIEAHKTKKIEVHNTETRPLYQGRITAKELAANGIKVKHFVDSAIEYALKKVDVMLIGADAIISTGNIINKIGSSVAVKLAKEHDIPVYVCTDSWKFDADTVYGVEEPIEFRSSKEIWENNLKNIEVVNPAFDIINPEWITGIISELGVFKPEVFVEELKRSVPWMFNNS